MSDTLHSLRQLGARAHQLRAATRAADHFMATHMADDRDTGTWLMSCAVDLAQELATDADALARRMKEQPADGPPLQAVQRLRVRAHQLHAAARAADHFLEQDEREDIDTGCWLIACARNVAQRLATEIDDCIGSTKLQLPEPALDAHDAALIRRVAHLTEPARDLA